jgi:hypothetical protein
MPAILWNAGEEATPSGRVQAPDGIAVLKRPHRRALDTNAPTPESLREIWLATGGDAGCPAITL